MNEQIISYVEAGKGLIEITIGLKKKRKKIKNKINTNKKKKISNARRFSQVKK